VYLPLVGVAHEDEGVGKPLHADADGAVAQVRALESILRIGLGRNLRRILHRSRMFSVFWDFRNCHRYFFKNARAGERTQDLNGYNLFS
jgi:hypothetical protein